MIYDLFVRLIAYLATEELSNAKAGTVLPLCTGLHTEHARSRIHRRCLMHLPLSTLLHDINMDEQRGGIREGEKHLLVPYCARRNDEYNDDSHYDLSSSPS